MARLWFTTVFILLGQIVFAQCPAPTTPTFQTKNGAGSWTTAGDWSIGPPTYPLVSGAYTIPAGDIVVIESSNFALSSSLIIYGKLILNGKLNMAAGTYVDVKEGGVVCCADTPCNAAERLNIGGNQVWSGDDGSVSGPAYTDGSAPLPIVLSYFNAYLRNNTVELVWATEKETDFDYFEIQRGNEAFNFTSILKVPGAGYNTETLQRYTAVDLNPLIGVTYYRLKAVDLDGSYEYFRPVSVVNDSERKITVAPNPVRGNSIRYSINFQPQSFDQIVLLDAIGNEIMTTPVQGSENQLVFDNSLKPGAYILRYQSSTFQKFARVIVTN
jgi:hypothetical protein